MNAETTKGGRASTGGGLTRDDVPQAAPSNAHPDGASAPTAPRRTTKSKVSSFREDDGEFWFRDMGALFTLASAIVSGTTAALVLAAVPETWLTHDAKEVLWGVAFLVGTLAGSSLTFLGYIYKDEHVQAAARTLAQEGLLNGRKGSPTRKALHALDRKAHQLSTLIQDLTSAHTGLAASSAPEPLLLNELTARCDTAKQELEQVRAKANALAFSYATTLARDDAALSGAMGALAKSRAIRSA